MAKKEPKTEKGKARKLWTGDGRKRTPGEKAGKAMEEMGKDLFGGGKKKGKKKK